MPVNAFSEKIRKSLFKMSYTLSPASGSTSTFGTFFEAIKKFLSISEWSMNNAESIFILLSLFLNRLVFGFEILNSFKIFNFPSFNFLDKVILRASLFILFAALASASCPFLLKWFFCCPRYL